MATQNQSAVERCGTDPTGEFTVQEEEQQVTVRGMLPEFDAKDLVLEVKDGELWIDAVHVEGQGDRKFSHRVPLPAGIVPGPVQAGTFINGVLELHLPKQRRDS
jgi:HSP20 family molecular chaperone IbpA